MQTGIDDPTVMSVLEFYTQVSLGDCRRETAIHVSKKERKKHLFIDRHSCSMEVPLLCNEQARCVRDSGKV